MHTRVIRCIAVLVLVGCAASPASPPDAASSITDAAYLTQPLWNDGQAEVAFYQVERLPEGQEAPEAFVAGSYLVKHDFDQAAMAKAGDAASDAVSSFKYALFYEFERGSYQFKHSYVVNAAQADVRPLKASFASFDWCSNLYRELAFHPNGRVDVLMRSDDYGNRSDRFEYRATAYPAHVLPLLVRALDFMEAEAHTFAVVQEDGTYVEARARLVGTETLNLPGGPAEAERIAVTYDAPVASLLTDVSDTEETYWRGTGPDRLLLRLAGATGRYHMTLVEHLRTPYWQENLWPRLQRVTTRP